jgi:sugar O-acyltransferase (sialic acid O-acetyltransferase NeuD family)
MAKIVIFGAEDIAKLADYYFTHDSEHEVVAYTVDRAYRQSDSYMNRPLVDFEEVERLYPPADYQLFVAVSYTKMNQLRALKYVEAKAKGYTLPSYISSRCTFLSQFQPGDNCFILEDNTIQPFAQIGNNVTLWSGNHIGHDSVIEDHCYLTSQVVVSGHVRIQPYCFLGVNATLRNGITIGASSLIGAGAIIMQDTEEGAVFVPARSLQLDKKSDQINL